MTAPRDHIRGQRNIGGDHQIARHYQFGNFDLTFFLIMFPAAIIGGFIAPQIAKRVSPLTVKRIAVVGLLILALNLLGVY